MITGQAAGVGVGELSGRMPETSKQLQMAIQYPAPHTNLAIPRKADGDVDRVSSHRPVLNAVSGPLLRPVNAFYGGY